jgi:hypothetical protein
MKEKTWIAMSFILCTIMIITGRVLSSEELIVTGCVWWLTSSIPILIELWRLVK